MKDGFKRAASVAKMVLALAAGSAAGWSGLVVASSPTVAGDSRPAVAASPSKQVGTASFYADRYAGRKMADGTPMRPDSNNAASLTLPLGSTAKVTNLETGKTALVVIRDRGPYVKGRIIDLSPATASVLGISKRQGLAKVEVLPLTTPASRSGKLASLR